MAISKNDAVDILKAALVMAVVDGKVTDGERAVMKAVAQRAGIRPDDLETMIREVADAPGSRQKLFERAIAEPERAMQLLVAAAVIDGRVSEPERHLLVEVSDALGIGALRFNELFQAGMMSAKRVRATPDNPGPSASAHW